VRLDHIADLVAHPIYAIVHRLFVFSTRTKL
jgi:hypothetical protein